MKTLKQILATVLFAGLTTAVVLQAEEPKNNAKNSTPNAKASEKAKPYPLDFCLVSDEKFAGSEMKPFEMVNDGQTIKFCCKNCVKDFNKDKTKYLAKLASEIKKQDERKQADKK